MVKSLSDGAPGALTSVMKRLALAAGFAVAMGSAAHAINYSEGAVVCSGGDPTTCNENNPATHTFTEVADLSGNSASPTSFGAQTPLSNGTLTVGDNYLAGAIVPYGPRVGPNGERQTIDDDYVTFTIAPGDLLTGISFLSNGSSYNPTDQPTRVDKLFMGIALGNTVNVTLPSAAGLIGYTLLTSGDIGSNSVLQALAASNYPGFSGPPFDGGPGQPPVFTGPLGTGTYTLWFEDGDGDVHYNFDLQVAAAPEPGTWALLLAGIGGLGLVLRRARATGGALSRSAAA